MHVHKHDPVMFRQICFFYGRKNIESLQEFGLLVRLMYVEWTHRQVVILLKGLAGRHQAGKAGKSR